MKKLYQNTLNLSNKYKNFTENCDLTKTTTTTNTNSMNKIIEINDKKIDELINDFKLNNKNGNCNVNIMERKEMECVVENVVVIKHTTPQANRDIRRDRSGISKVVV